MKGKQMNKTMILAAVWLTMLAPAAMAHRFNVVMAVPANLAQDIRRDMSAAFLVASEELDAHANEESDGHLGGLDVYITVAGTDQASRISAADADIIIQASGVEIQAGDAVAFAPLASDSSQAAAFLNRPLAPGLAPFADRFAERSGNAPGPEATQAYIAARQIDLAVRAQMGTDDRAALSRSLSRN